MSKISYEEKVNAIRKIKAGKESVRGVAKKLGTSESSIRRWQIKYVSQGAESLKKAH